MNCQLNRFNDAASKYTSIQADFNTRFETVNVGQAEFTSSKSRAVMMMRGERERVSVTPTWRVTAGRGDVR